ncbi:phosphoribosyltransferase family protein [Streptomyces sp. bgisy082]|uniref:phosphoribosyltransferase family protein n=1 Tax=Streptomyces sp. bgisy082 TaxID=3413776 RepID=UPI003D75CC3D
MKDFSRSWSEVALVKNSPSKAEGRRAKVVDGLFSATPVVEGKRILLFDDTFTTGGTLASAAHALKAAGAHTVVGISIGRQLSNEWEVSKGLVATLPQRDLTLDSCVVHGGPSKDPFAALFGRAR